MEVLIANRQNRHKIPLEKIRQKAKAVLSALDNPDAELSILFLDDPQMAELNRTYLNRQGPTNVIAFPMRDEDPSSVNPYLIGDVVISTDTAYREAEEAGSNLDQRLTELLVHGILHLLGYDHEDTEERALEMEAKNRELLERLGHTTP